MITSFSFVEVGWMAAPQAVCKNSGAPLRLPVILCFINIIFIEVLEFIILLLDFSRIYHSNITPITRVSSFPPPVSQEPYQGPPLSSVLRTFAVTICFFIFDMKEVIFIYCGGGDSYTQIIKAKPLKSHKTVNQ